MKLGELTPIQALGGVLVINTVLVGSMTQLTDLFGPVMANHILSVCVIGSGICGGFIMNMGGLGSQAKNVMAAGGTIDVGPNASPSLAKLAMDPAQSKIDAAPGASAAVAAIAKSAAVLLFAFLIVGLVAPAHAATKAPASVSGKRQVTKAQAMANPLTVLQTFTADDLNAALADAKANNDTAAVNCYSALLPIVQSGVANPLPTGLGGFRLLQKARDAKTLLANLQSPNGPLAQLNIACAPVIIDAQNTMIQLGILGGGVLAVGATGGVALPGLSALLPALGGL